MDENQCPLCLEPIEADDIDFFPCPCGYQICRFCWHRLANEEDNIETGKSGRGLCPACRQEYPESPVGFNSNLTIEAMSELVKNKKKKKKQANKQKLNQQQESKKTVNLVKKEEKNLAGLRVVQKNLVFVIGIPSRLSQEDLRREFSKFGKIHKLVIGSNGNSLVNSVYVTYSRPEDAIKAIQTLNQSNQCNGNNQIIINGLKDVKGSKKGANLTLRASLGTTKYCTHWLKNMQCPKLPECMYLHELADPEASFTKEEMQQGKHTEYEKKLINQYLSRKSVNGALNQRYPTLPQDHNKQGTVDFDGESNEMCNYVRDDIGSYESNCSNEGDSGTFNIDRRDDCGNQNSLDEIIGISSDSSTSFSTCSSGNSLPHPHISSLEEEEQEEDEGSGKENRCKSPGDESMPPNSPGTSIEDDGLDFDPITISTNGLEDLIRNHPYEDNVSCLGMSQSIPVSTGYSQSVNYPSPSMLSRSTMRDDQLTQEHISWRNSLKALLPNVNITFAGSSTSASPNYFKPPAQTQQQQQQTQQQPQHHQQQIPFVHAPSQITPWFQQNSQHHQHPTQHQVHPTHANPFSITNGLQNCQHPMARTHQGFIARPVIRQKQPPPVSQILIEILKYIN
ncbi:uncharacterized protein LOC128390844 [Panonychus citri]|uniref:uncharacterized protein LOC128390844 n=1 Tax=Panonychus citri TaxID=50023 RepID=UPI00230742E5|nr:uncharacterized protein LOC128390844 [Panonychus citri]